MLALFANAHKFLVKIDTAVRDLSLLAGTISVLIVTNPGNTLVTWPSVKYISPETLTYI